MTIENFYAYFKDLSERNKVVLHNDATHKAFFTNVEEFLDAQGNNKVKYPAVVMDNIEGYLTGSSDDGAVDRQETGILVVEQVTKIDNFLLQQQAQDRMKALAISFVKRMKHDVERCEPRAIKLLQDFNATNIKYKVYGPVFDNCFGVHLSFKPEQTISLDYDETEWND